MHVTWSTNSALPAADRRISPELLVDIAKNLASNVLAASFLVVEDAGRGSLDTPAEISNLIFDCEEVETDQDDVAE